MEADSRVTRLNLMQMGREHPTPGDQHEIHPVFSEASGKGFSNS